MAMFTPSCVPREQTGKSRAVTEPAISSVYTGKQKALPSDTAALRTLPLGQLRSRSSLGAQG